MARPERHDADYFPIWNPQRSTRSNIKSYDFKTRYKALRNSSSAFIKRDDVRRIITEKCSNKCAKCGSSNNLQIDHIKSVYLCARGKFPISELNIFSNLQLLCNKCNSAKNPEESQEGVK
jgi:5-methylcytosine-specific restriction endonuclease McrA